MDWVQEQKQTGHHKLAVIGFPLIIFLAYIHPVLYIIGIIAFCLVTSFRLLKTMLLWMLILGGISAAMPFLAPIIVVIMIILFIMRIRYVVKNWKPFLFGLIIYGFSGFLIAHSFELYNYSMGMPFIEAVVVSVIGFIAMRFLLITLYRDGYSSYAALGIMGSVPIIIISFILPFLKLHVGGDYFAADGAHVHTGGMDGTHTGPVHDASTPHPQTEYVHSYVRTAPDADPTNNLSYHGPNPSPVNQDLVQVHGYVRTVPDGDPTNNFSYHGADQYVAATADPAPSHHTGHQDTKLEDVSQSLVIGQVAVDRVIDAAKKENEKRK